VFAPVVGGAGLDGDAGAAVAGQDAFAVFRGLVVEGLGARHGDDAHGDAVAFQLTHGVHGQTHLGAGGDENDLELRIDRVVQDIAPPLDPFELLVGARLVVQF